MTLHDNLYIMLKYQFKICAALLFCIGFSGIKAQSILKITETSETNSTFSTSEIRKLTFSSNQLVVHIKNETSSLFAFDNIEKLDFNNIATSDLTSVNITSLQTVLYPNPVIDRLYIKMEFPNKCKISIEIYNLQGKLLLNQSVVSPDCINVSELQKGMYICRLKSCDKIETLKFIKQ